MPVRIYWYPKLVGALESLELDFVSDIQHDEPEVVAATAETIAGGQTRQLYGDWRRLVMVREHLDDQDDEATIMALRSLETHLRQGHSIGLSLDGNDGEAWAGFASGTYSRGSTTLGASTNRYAGWSGAAALAAGDRICVHSPSPGGGREWHEVTGVTTIGSTVAIGIARGLFYDHSGPIMVRKRHFWPVLKLPEDQLGTPILTSRTQGATWDLRLELREDNAELWSFAETGEVVASASGGQSPQILAQDMQAGVTYSKVFRLGLEG